MRESSPPSSPPHRPRLARSAEGNGPTAKVAGSFISTTSESVLISHAPTPFNTYFTPGDFGREASTSLSLSGQDEGVIYDPQVIGDVPLHPSIPPSVASRNPSTFSSHASSHLLPTPLTSPIPSIDNHHPIPHSTRPVPPPLSLRHKPNQFIPSDPTHISSAVDSDIIAVAPTYPEGSANAGSPELEASTSSSGSKGRRHAQEDRDTQRLKQLGYDAVLGRDYTFWSSLAISSICIGCLQGVIYAVSGAYSYGGPLMILIAWPLSGIFCLFLTLTLAELASAYPASGAMASWAWKCARGGIGHERGWGWLMGGVVLGGHVGNVLLVTWEICNVIAGTMTLSYGYEKKGWHLLCFFIAVLLLCGVIGSTAWGRSHRFWLLAGVYFALIWLILNITLLTTVVRQPTLKISTHFYNDTGWSSRAYVALLGWQFCTIASGADASAHMAEETQKPSRNVPNAMIVAVILTYLLGYISIILLLLAVQSDDAALISQQDFPFGHILETAINRTGAIGITCLIVIVLFLQVLAQLQASSRFVFALARDNAMPLSESIRWTNSSKQPVVANWVVVGLSLPFCLLTMASQSALYSVLAVTASSLSYWGYVTPVFLYLVSGKDLQTEGRTSWSLRRWSKPVGWVGVLYGVLVIVAQMLPGQTPATAESISWSPVIIVGTALTCYLTWRLFGQTHYSGPIRALTKWQTGVEIDLQSALASSRSKPSGDSVDRFDRVSSGQRRFDELDSYGKLGTPEVVHTVTVESARTLDSQMIDGEWTQGTGTGWTDATASSPGEDSVETLTGQGDRRL